MFKTSEKGWYICLKCGKTYTEFHVCGQTNSAGTPQDIKDINGPFASPIPKSENILEEANRLVSGDRQASYKHPLEDYTATADMWKAMIQKRYGISVPLTPDFCCLMMAAMKISRETGLHKRDNLVDLAGYARCVEMCLEEKP